MIKGSTGIFCYLNQAKGSPNYTQLRRTIKGSLQEPFMLLQEGFHLEPFQKGSILNL